MYSAGRHPRTHLSGWTLGEGHPAAVCMHWSLGGLGGKGWSGRFVTEHAFRERLEGIKESGVSIAIRSNEFDR